MPVCSYEQMCLDYASQINHGVSVYVNFFTRWLISVLKLWLRKIIDACIKLPIYVRL